MVKIFLLRVRRFRVQNADHPAHDRVQSLAHALRVPARKRLVQRPHGLRVPHNRFFEPFLNLQNEHFPHFAVGNHQLVYVPLHFARLRQIPRGEQYAPQILDALFQLAVGQFQPQALLDRLPGDQPLDFLLRALVRLVHKPPHHVVSAGVDPVILRMRVRLGAQAIHMVDHIPGAVHLRIAKAITIVPILGFLIVR